MTQCKQACQDDKQCAFVSYVKWASAPSQCYHYSEYPTKQEYCSYGKSFKKYRGEGCEDRKYFSHCKQQHTLLGFAGGRGRRRGGVTIRGRFRNVIKILVYCLDLIEMFYNRHIFYIRQFMVSYGAVLLNLTNDGSSCHYRENQVVYVGVKLRCNQHCHFAFFHFQI